jgi:predicted dehydrogenase
VSPEELCADVEVDAVYIAVPTGIHADWIDRALAAGKHVWCEKSLVSNAKTWARVVDRAMALDLTLCECFMFRFHPQFIRLQYLLKNGAVGTIRKITARFGFPHFSSDNIRYAKDLGGGALLDCGAYPLAAVRLLTGELPVGGVIVVEREPGFTVDTAGSGIIRLSSGVHAHLAWGFGHFYRNEIEIWGDQGVIFADRIFSKPASLATTLVLVNEAGHYVEKIAEANHFVAMFDHLHAACYDHDLRGVLWHEAKMQKEFMFGLEKLQ